MIATWGATYPVAYEYDAFGRMSAMATTRDPARESVNLLTLLPAGLTLADVSDPAYPSDLDTTRWLYHEPTGLLTNKVYADGKGTAYSYTPDGKLATRTWARGITASYEYATCCGSLTNILYSDSTPAVSFSYDRLGRQTNAVQRSTGVPPVVHEYRYDPANLSLVEETIVAFGETNVLARSQDALGRPAGIALSNPDTPTPPYALTYSFDAYGRFHSVSSTVDSAVSVANYSYLPGSHLLSGYTVGDFTRSVTYEAHRDLIAAVSNTWGGDLVSAFDYANDALGRRTARIDSGTAFASTQANAFGYNVRSEVASVAMRNGTSSYTFDPIGNRTTVSLPDEPAALAYLSNPLNQYTNILCATAPPREDVPTYDPDGNMLVGPAGPDRATLAMVWDAENRLIAVTNGNTVVLNDYDYRSRRTRKRVLESGTLASDHRYVYDGWNLVRELSTVDGSLFTTNSFVWGLDLSGSLQGAGGIAGLLSVNSSVGSAPSVVHISTFDANGNISEYLATNGTVAAHYEYDAFGRTIAQSGSLADSFAHHFSTKYLDDETGLYYYGYRYYSPELGRWVSRDPIGERGGWNRYVACRNTCTDRVDALGLASHRWGDGILPIRPPFDLIPLEPLLPPPPSDIAIGDHRFPVSSDPAPDDWADEMMGLSPGGFDSGFFGFEFYWFAGGGGLTWVQCCDERQNKVRMLFWKRFFGIAKGGSVSAGRLHRVKNGHWKSYEGKECRPENYTGYFAEVGVAFGPLGAGIDVGTDETDTKVPLPVPWELTGTVEWGPTIGYGWMLKRVYCYYEQIGSPVKEPCGCSQIRAPSPIFVR